MNTLEIISLAATVIFIVQLILCFVIGYRKGFIKALFGLGANLIAGVMAVFIAKVVALYAKGFFVARIHQMIEDAFHGSNGVDFFKEDGMDTIIQSTSTTLIALSLFLTLYLILYFLIKIPRNKIYKRYYPADQNAPSAETGESIPHKRVSVKKISGAFTCCISGVLSLLLLSMPFTTLIYSLNRGLSGTESSYASKLDAKLSPLIQSPVTVMVNHSGGPEIFNFLTSIRYKEQEVLLTDELSSLIFLGFASQGYVTNTSLSEDEKKALLTHISNELKKSVFMPQVTSDLMVSAANAFESNKDFLGLKVPVPEGPFQEVFQDFFTIVEKTSANEIRNNLPSLLSISSAAYYIVKEAPNSSNAYLEIFAYQDVLKDFLLALYNNDDFKNLIPKIVSAGIETICQELGLKVSDNTLVQNLTTDVTKTILTNEAEIISDLLHSFLSIENENGSLDLNTMSLEQCQELSSCLEAGKKSIFLKNIIPDMQSQLISKNTNDLIDTDFVDALSSANQKETKELIKNLYIQNQEVIASNPEYQSQIANIAALYGVDIDSIIK